MALYILKRILLFIPTLLGITLITFVLMQSLPGDPAAGMAGERASPETIARIRAELGQDKPLALQYIGYLKLIASGELGRSYYTNRRILDDLLQKFPNTLRLALAAMLFASFFGVMLGVLSAAKRSTIWDRFIALISVGGISIPVFWLGPALGHGRRQRRLPHPARRDARHLFPVVHRARDAFVHAGDPFAALYIGGKGQGALRSRCRIEARAPKLAHPRDHTHWPRSRLILKRRGPDRNHLRLGRPRPLR